VPIGVRIVGALLLWGAAAAKVVRPRASSDALASFGLPGNAERRVVWALLVATEVVLGGGIATGSVGAAYAAAALMLAFGAALVGAILRGRAGLPCGCFGARSRIGWRAVARNVGLAALFAALPSVPALRPSATGWLAIGLGVAIAAICALAVAVLALAREVGALRLAVGPQSALDVAYEGPEIGSRVDLAGRFHTGPEARLALAVFTSASCPVCSALEPSIDFVARDPRVAVSVFDELRDGDVWSALDVPGSPYAVGLGLDGTVLAKGTFNSLAQLESVVTTAVRRGEEAVSA
jgi:hypothetical protein